MQTLAEYIRRNPDAPVEALILAFPEHSSWDIRQTRRTVLSEAAQGSGPDINYAALPKSAQNALRAGFFKPTQVSLTEREPVKPLWKRAGEQHFVMSDIHGGEQDDHAVDVALQVSQSIDIDTLTIAGDGLDVGSLSSHVPAAHRPFRWVDERREAIKPLIKIREAHQDLPITYLFGNHEDRVERFMGSQAPQLQGLFSMQHILGIDSLGFDFPEHNRVLLANDQLLIKHGTKVRGEAGQSVTAEVREAGMSVIMGHVHRLSYVPVTKTVQAIGGKQPWVGVELGHLQTRPSYIPIEQTANWQQGCALVTVYQNGMFGIELIPIHNGTALFRGRMFTSRVKVR